MIDHAPGPDEVVVCIDVLDVICVDFSVRSFGGGNPSENGLCLLGS